MAKTYNIIMVGPQASGKGTQAVKLAEELKIPHISTGDIFREMRTQDTALGKQVRELIDNGKFVPDEVTNRIVAERMKKPDVKGGFVLDGYPRNLLQAEYLDGLTKINYCIFIDISDAEAMKRIGSRRVCSSCKAGYNVVTQKPKKEGVCDKCSGTLVIRDDDKPEAVKVRLAKYHADTSPILKYYEKKGVLYRINGEQGIEKVFEDVMKKVR